MSDPKHFLDLDRVDRQDLRGILDLGKALKDGTTADPRPLQGKTRLTRA